MFENTLFVGLSEKKTEGVNSSAQLSNFSELAQDNFVEYIQVLTEKILGK